MGQRHVDFTVTAQNELSESIVMEKVMVTSGSGSKVLDSTGVAQATSQGIFPLPSLLSILIYIS